MPEDKGEKSISEIRDALAAKMGANPGAINKVLENAVALANWAERQSYNSSCELEEGSWFDPTAIKRVTSIEIDLCRRKVIEAEAYHQFSCRFVEAMIGEGLFDVGTLPERIGDAPEFRAAASYATMFSNYEIMLFHLLQKEAGAVTHNTGLQMSTRYYVATNTPQPILRYQAKVLVGLGLWDVDSQPGRHKFRPGPILPPFMASYWKVQESALGKLDEIVAGFRRL